MKVISPTLFAMMVVMALATTMATTPLLHLLTPPSRKPGSCGAHPVRGVHGDKLSGYLGASKGVPPICRLSHKRIERGK